MKQKRVSFVACIAPLLFVPLILLWTGCKGDSAPAVAPPSVPPPPVLHVRATTGDPLTSDPLSSVVWQSATWNPLTVPLHDGRTTPPTSVASLYTSTYFYVAFICADGEPGRQDQAQVWLDTSRAQNGTDFFSISVSPDGHITRAWYRCSAPPQPKEDGSPNFLHPISQIPEYPIAGLQVRTGRSQLEGQPAWTLVVGIPLQGLPLPLKLTPPEVKEGSHWRVNLIRAEVLNTAAGPDVLQSNFSPVYPGSQPVAPYHMTDLILEGAGPRVALDPKPFSH